MPYLFAHFREKLTPDGEQIYFAVSKNGYDFTAVTAQSLLSPATREKWVAVILTL